MNDIFLSIAVFFLNRLSYKSPTNQRLHKERLDAIKRLHQCK